MQSRQCWTGDDEREEPEKVAWMPNATIGISASPSAPESSPIKVTTLKATHNAGMVGMNQIRLTAIMRGSSK